MAFGMARAFALRREVYRYFHDEDMLLTMLMV